MPKKTLVKIDEGMTAASVAYGCAALLDAGLEEQLGPASSAEEGLDCGGRLAVRVALRLEVLKHNLEAASEALDRIGDELHRCRKRRDVANWRALELDPATVTGREKSSLPSTALIQASGLRGVLGSTQFYCAL